MQHTKNGNKIMQYLYKVIENRSLEDRHKNLKETLTSMISKDPLVKVIDEKLLVDTLELNGEFQVVLLTYEDLEKELHTKVLKNLIKSSLQIVVSFEEDSNSYEKIKDFSEYIYRFSSDAQSLSIGVDKVKNLSQFPIKILFGGILPINEMQMFIGKKLYEVVAKEPDYFQPLFALVRKKITEEIGVPLLPLYPEVDLDMSPYGVRLMDPVENKMIVSFEVESCNTKENIDKYLLKLFYVYKKLAQELKNRL